MPKVSIIIAMYNIEDYIAYCINSCVNQEGVSPEDYEIIIVNDGATDNSLYVAQGTIKNVSNARIVTRVNGGLSAARNTGIDAAKGEYIWFVDGDDAISPNGISLLLSNINRFKSDAYIINFSTFDGDKKINTSNFIGSDIPLSGEEYHFSKNRILPMMAWLTIYKTEMIKKNNLIFMPDIIHEDLEFSIRAHHTSSSIIFIKEDLYLYRLNRAGSIMNEIQKDNTRTLKSLLDISKSFKAFFCKIDNEFVRKLYGFSALTFVIKLYDPKSLTTNEAIRLYQENKNIILKDLWNTRKWKYRLFTILIACMPRLLIKTFIPMIDKTSKFI